MWPILIVIVGFLTGAAFIGAGRTVRKHWRKVLWLVGAVGTLVLALILIQNFQYWGPALLALLSALLQGLVAVAGIVVGLAVVAVIVGIVIAGRTIGAEKREAAEQEKREIAEALAVYEAEQREAAEQEKRETAEALAVHEAKQSAKFPNLYESGAPESAAGSIYGGR